MKIHLWNSFLSSLREMIDRIFRRPPKPETHFPSCVEELVSVLGQARDNKTSVKVVGGSFPTAPVHGDILVNLEHMDRLLGLDLQQKTVITEPGMLLSTLSNMLATVNLCLDLSGRVPDLTVIDAISIGGLGSKPSGLTSSLLSVTVLTPGSDDPVTWSWDSSPRHMSALVSGLGMVTVVLSATFRCSQLNRVTEISYLSSVREVMDSWGLVRSSHQQLHWFPFTELVVISHTSPLDRLSGCTQEQPYHSKILGNISEWLASFTRKVNILLFTSLPLLSSMLARVQFISMWTAARHRSDYSHHPVQFSDCSSLRGSTWLIPLSHLPPLLRQISNWSSHNPRPVSSPLYIQTVEERQQGDKQPFLAPQISGDKSDGPMAAVWYDWFLPETSPDPLLVSQFESLFHTVGGVRCWSAERLVSPLLLSNSCPGYRDWCKVKAELDPSCLLGSGYVHGTLFSLARREGSQPIS